MATLCHHARISFPLARILPSQSCIPDSLQQRLPAQRRFRCAEPGRLWEGQLSRILDAELRGHVCPRPCIGKRNHGHRSTMDGLVAYLLGYQQCLDLVLRHTARTAILLLGLGMATAASRHS